MMTLYEAIYQLSSIVAGVAVAFLIFCIWLNWRNIIDWIECRSQKNKNHRNDKSSDKHSKTTNTVETPEARNFQEVFSKFESEPCTPRMHLMNECHYKCATFNTVDELRFYTDAYEIFNKGFNPIESCIEKFDYFNNKKDTCILCTRYKEIPRAALNCNTLTCAACWDYNMKETLFSNVDEVVDDLNKNYKRKILFSLMRSKVSFSINELLPQYNGVISTDKYYISNIDGTDIPAIITISAHESSYPTFTFEFNLYDSGLYRAVDPTDTIRNIQIKLPERIKQ